jgi:hypothetical protein
MNSKQRNIAKKYRKNKERLRKKRQALMALAKKSKK